MPSFRHMLRSYMQKFQCQCRKQNQDNFLAFSIGVAYKRYLCLRVQMIQGTTLLDDDRLKLWYTFYSSRVRHTKEYPVLA